MRFILLGIPLGVAIIIALRLLTYRSRVEPIATEEHAREIDILADQFDTAEEEFFDHLQALEPRTPYDGHQTWPVYGEEPEFETVINGNGEIIRLYVNRYP